MNDPRAIADAFEGERRHLFALAYRMMGSAADAEDVVQDAYVRWHASPRDGVLSPRAFLSTIVTRLCLDALGSARRRRETYVGPWLPEPVPTAELGPGAASDPTLSLAFLLLLERLTPLERAVYLLREVFDHSHREIAEIVGSNEGAVRQVHHRATTHLGKDGARFPSTREDHARLLGAFLMTARTGDVDGLARLLAHDAVALSDSGGKARAARRPVKGATDIAKFFVGIARKPEGAGLGVRIVDANGLPAALIVGATGRPYALLALDLEDGLVGAVHFVANPEKLARMANAPTWPTVAVVAVAPPER
jgi:RNA polymerase sigma-70 factor (ECF subfamily)